MALGVMPCSTSVTAIALNSRDSLLVRESAGQLEEGHVAEVEVAEDLARQVLAAHHDAVARRPAEVAADLAHVVSFFSTSGLTRLRGRSPRSMRSISSAAATLARARDSASPPRGAA